MNGLKISKMQVINNPKEDAKIPIVQNGTNYSMPFGTLSKLLIQIYENSDILKQVSDAATEVACRLKALTDTENNMSAAEEQREVSVHNALEDIAKASGKADAATEAANTAAAEATTAKQNADAAANACNTATDAANTAASTATDATNTAINSIMMYDCSARGTITFATLDLAIAAVPLAYQKGGLHIKFVDTASNKYNTYFLTTPTWSTATADWQYSNENSEYVKNGTGVTVPKGKVVYINSSTGDNPLFLLATNTDYNIAARTWGMTYDGINADAVGRVIHFGLIKNLDTSAYTAGTELWLGVNGEFTNVRPTLPAAQIYIGMVICSSATVGSIFIDLRHVPKLTSLSDVKEEIYTDGDVPVFNETNRRFEKQNIVSEVGISDYEEYNPSITYETGEIRTYQGKLYKCISDIISPEQFNNSNWAKTSINEIITNSLTKKLDSSKINVLSEDEYTALTTKEEGKIYFIYS